MKMMSLEGDLGWTNGTGRECKKPSQSPALGAYCRQKFIHILLFRARSCNPSFGLFFLAKMSATLCKTPYEIVRLITSRLPFWEAQRMSESCSRLASLFDFNNDPRLDYQFAIFSGMSGM
jgi:hypothetical protein